MCDTKQKFILFRIQGQSATELAIFGAILIFVISLIFRQGISGGNFMNAQLKATRFAMSKSLESSTATTNSRNSASVLVIEDRLAGDFTDKFGSRDRVPVIASGNASFSAQMFQPVDEGDVGNEEMLPHYDVWINGQKFSFLTARFKTVTLPTSQGTLAACDQAHTSDTRCWDPNCRGPNLGCVILQKEVENYPGSGYDPAGGPGGKYFDLSFDKTDPVAIAGVTKDAVTGTKMGFMWQWQPVKAVKGMPTADSLDVDGDYHSEQILKVNDDGTLVTSILVIDQQDGDIDMTLDGRNLDAKVGLLDNSQMFSFTRSGTTYRIQEGKLFDANDKAKFIRNMNSNDHIDFVQRAFKLSRDTGRFCNGNTPLIPTQVEACNNCFSQANIQKTCFDADSAQIFVRSRVLNENGRSWFTQTEPGS